MIYSQGKVERNINDKVKKFNDDEDIRREKLYEEIRKERNDFLTLAHAHKIQNWTLIEVSFGRISYGSSYDDMMAYDTFTNIEEWCNNNCSKNVFIFTKSKNMEEYKDDDEEESENDDILNNIYTPTSASMKNIYSAPYAKTKNTSKTLKFNTRDIVLLIYFEDPEEALLFKMTWL